jgi:hypothetical protein
VQNTGSVAGNFSVVPRDTNNALVFSGEKGRIPLEPNQIARVDLGIQSRESSLFGGSEVYPYEVNVVSRTGGRQQLEAEAMSGSMLPVWLLYALIFVCTLACAALAIAAIINRDRWFGQAPTPTVSFAGLVATQTAAAMTQTAVFIPGTETITGPVDLTATAQTATAAADLQATATSAAGTADAQGDSDGDGLSNAQEGVIGTDPFNSDTDGDGLSDGQEVLIYGTNPLNIDTDMDGFGDGQEVLVLLSDPLNPNDPVNQMPPGPKPPGPPTPIPPKPPGPPTRTPGPPPMPPSPTFTPLPPPPTATFTPLPPPPTATFTPLPPPPTATWTPSPTPTYTPEPGPGPEIVCAPPATIDGFFNPSSWPSTPFVQFTGQTNPARRVEIYFVKNSGNIYLAFLMNDPVGDSSDEMRVMFDANGNGGDPDAADRFVRVNRNGDWEVWAGIGSNSDSQAWDSTYPGTNWNVASSDGGSQWTVEMSVNSTTEMPGLANPFRMMSQVQFTTDLAIWPSGADGNNASNWQTVINPACSYP